MHWMIWRRSVSTFSRSIPICIKGRSEDELTYLGTYAEAPDACVILAYDGLTVIGAATGMPLIHEDAQMLDAFAGTTFPLNEVYYVGELLFRPAYRNCGLGQKLLDRLESHIRSLGRYRRLTCATVERPDDHPLRPRDYIPITRFLARTGFVRLSGVTTSFMWRRDRWCQTGSPHAILDQESRLMMAVDGSQADT